MRTKSLRFVFGKLRVATISSAVLLASVPADAVGTREFRLDSTESLSGGDLKGTAVDSQGQVRAGLFLGSLQLPDANSVWCTLGLADGSVLIATGNTGKILRVHQGKVSEYASTGQLAVTSLAFDSKGAVIAGTIPNGKLFHIDAQGKTTPYSDLPGTQHVWALAYDAKTKSVFAATGPEGKLFRIDDTGKAQVHYDSDEAHLISLAVAPDGTLYTGSSGKGILYRIVAAGRASVMYDFAADDVKSIVIGRDGRIYTISNEHTGVPDAPSHGGYFGWGYSSPGTSPAGPIKPSNLPRPGKGTLTRFDSDGRAELLLYRGDTHFQSLALGDDGLVYVGTADKGEVYAVDDNHTAMLMADTDERQVGALSMTGPNKYLVTSDPSVFHEVRSIGGPDAVWTSKVFDAGMRAQFGHLSWRGVGTVELSTRTGNTEKPDTTWSEWSKPMTAAAPITNPPARFFQVRARFAHDPAAILREIVVPFVTDNARAVLTLVDIERKGGSSRGDSIPSSGDDIPKHNATIKVSWKVDNPDNDKLRFRVWYRQDGTGTWRDAFDPATILTEKSLEWDTSALPEGRYKLRVEASDELVNPPGLAKRHELQSATVIVDNTPPVVEELAVAGKHIRGKAVDGVSVISRIDVAVDPQTKLWTPYFPLDGIFDQTVEPFDLDVTSLVGTGSKMLVLRVVDAAGNVVVRPVEVK